MRKPARFEESGRRDDASWGSELPLYFGTGFSRVVVDLWLGVRRLALRKIRGPSASLGMTQEEDDTKSEQVCVCDVIAEPSRQRLSEALRKWDEIYFVDPYINSTE